MTVEEALKIDQKWTPIQARNDLERLLLTDERPANKVIALGVKALEKQIPKKPDTKITNRGIDITGEYNIDSDYICPICKCVVGDCEEEEHFYDFCPGCGQALDWSDTE